MPVHAFYCPDFTVYINVYNVLTGSPITTTIMPVMLSAYHNGNFSNGNF